MSNFLSYDDSFQLQSLEFYYISDARFSIDRITGDIKVIRHLDPLHTHNVTVYLRYNGTISLTDRFYRSTTSTLVQILYTMGKYKYALCYYIYSYAPFSNAWWIVLTIIVVLLLTCF